ncbi:hypothetical protein BG005_000799, partial [Podila minutissima]
AAASSNSGPSPMEVDAIHTKHISAEEKLRHRNNILRLHCAAADRFANDCPLKKARLAAVTIESEQENAQA